MELRLLTILTCTAFAAVSCGESDDPESLQGPCVYGPLQIVADLNTSPDPTTRDPDDTLGSQAVELTDMGGTLFFHADRKLFRTKGTPETTVAIRPIQGPVESFTVLGDTLMFTGQDSTPWGVWRSDGTAEGTLMVSPLADPRPGFSAMRAAVSGRHYYLVLRGSWSGSGLWRSDGTSAGTERLFTISEQEDVGAIHPFDGDILFFHSNADPAVAPTLRLMRSNGFQSGTKPLVTFTPPPYSNTPLARAGDWLVFGLATPEGAELWRSDGTAAGTTRVRSFPGTLGSWRGDLGGHVHFVTHTGDGTDLWRTDGTEAGTRRLGGQVPQLMSHAGGLFHVATATGLWTSDGTSAELRPIMTERLTALASLGSITVFSGDSGLWRTDGTPEGTTWIGEARRATLLHASGACLLLQTEGEIWQSDGTLSGTSLVQAVSRPLPAPVASGDRLYYAYDDGRTGHELWTMTMGSAGNPR